MGLSSTGFSLWLLKVMAGAILNGPTPHRLNPVLQKPLQTLGNSKREKFEERKSVRGGGLAQVAHWVDRRAVNANFVMYVRSGGPPAHADIADCVAAAQLLSYDYIEA